MLEFLPALQRQSFEKLMTGSFHYRPCLDEHRCVFLHVPKCAGSSVAHALFGGGVGHLPATYYQLADPDKYRRYYKFTFVRNPWDRLYSAYNYLLAGGAASRDGDWSNFIGGFASFDDFVRSWVTAENIERQLHLIPQYRYLTNRFGVIDLDFIGRFENLAADFVTVAAALKTPVTLPHINRSDRVSSYRKAYTPETRAIAAAAYHRDIELFGYEF